MVNLISTDSPRASNRGQRTVSHQRGFLGSLRLDTLPHSTSAHRVRVDPVGDKDHVNTLSNLLRNSPVRDSISSLPSPHSPGIRKHEGSSSKVRESQESLEQQESH